MRKSILARAAFLLLLVGLLVSCPAPEQPAAFTFVLAADMRNFAAGSSYFGGVCDAVAKSAPGSFMISPGDIDPPDDIRAVISDRIAPSYPWVPVVGNHEMEAGYSPAHPFSQSIEWLRFYAIPFTTAKGPAGAETTCFSFDVGAAHFAIINEYYDGTSDAALVAGHGYISAPLLAWLDADLAGSSQPVRFVVGHEPAYPQPDAEPPYRLRHETDSLNANPAQRDAFWATLKVRGVTAYLCGHTHDYSVVTVDGICQIDAGHARGIGDTGARSTFVKVSVSSSGAVAYETWRIATDGASYEITASGSL